MKKNIISLLLLLAAASGSAKPETRLVETSCGGFRLQTEQRLLAYGDTPCDSLNPGVRWWLSGIHRLTTDDLSLASAIPPASLGFPEACAPLVSTTWGQEAPYNYMCPLPDYSPWNGYLPDKTHCPTGCVATAVAQLMNYYRHPLHGQGSCSLNPEQTPGTTVYTVDFAEATYEWDLMLDNYNGDYTEAQAKAVALLNYHVGVASQMGYRGDASATDNYNAVLALQRYFDYDSLGVDNIERNNYTATEWMTLVYRELSQGRPILYEAVGIDLNTYGIYGHSFLIDGYDANGLVHVNWGWNGNSNGYYDIALLNPRDLAFDDYQMMSIGLQPLKHDELEHVSLPLANDQPSALVYSLGGCAFQNQASLPAGIYIRQGKKYVVRRR